MEVKVLGPDFEKQIIKSGVYIIELQFLGKNRSCMLLTEQATTNHYNHRIRIQLDERELLTYKDRIRYSELEFIKINGREYYLANFEREVCTYLMNLTYVCLNGIKHIRKKENRK